MLTFRLHNLIVSYVISNLVISASLNKVLQTNPNILGRSLSFSVFFAFIALAIYDHCHDKGNFGLFGGTISWVDICSLFLLLAGVEIYGSDPEPDVELIANNYSTIPQEKRASETELSGANAASGV